MNIEITNVDLLETMGFVIRYSEEERLTPYICPKYRYDVVVLAGETYDTEEMLVRAFFNKLVGSVFNVTF